MALVGAGKALSHLEFKAPNPALDKSLIFGGFGLQAARSLIYFVSQVPRILSFSSPVRHPCL